MSRGTRLVGKSPVNQDAQLGIWQKHETRHLPGGTVATFSYLPGVARYSAAHRALFGATRSITERAVFVTGPGAAPTAVWAAQARAQVVSWHDSIAENLSLTHSLAMNGCHARQTSLQYDYADLIAHSCDLALLHLPRGRERQTEMLRLGVAMLRPGGRLVFVGATNEGVRAALEDAKELCGRAGIVSRKGGYHAGVAYAPSEGIPLPDIHFNEHAIELDGRAAVVQSCVGVFAHDRLDGGAAALIQTMQITAGERILDLGCGTGLVGLVAMRRGGHLIATDVSARAVAGAQRTLEANSVPTTEAEVQAHVHLCVGAASVTSGTIDTVVTNPPFHHGHDVDFEVSQLFVGEAARVLKPRGNLFLVANSFLDYRPWLARHFASVGIASETSRFRVWTAHT